MTKPRKKCQSYKSTSEGKRLIAHNSSVKLSEIIDCMCTQFMPYRMMGRKKGRKKVECTLGCMMCGRNSTAFTPRECVELWNKENSMDVVKAGRKALSHSTGKGVK